MSRRSEATRRERLEKARRGMINRRREIKERGRKREP